MKRWLLFFSLCCYAICAMASTTTIRFATEATYPPFEYIDETGAIQGFDIDIAKAICTNMKADCTFANQSFSSLIPSLQLGKYDAIIAALGTTPERRRQVSFTHAYYEPSASFVGRLTSDHVFSVDNKTIGVQQGSTFETYLRDKYAQRISIKSYASIQDAFLDLDAGRVDMVITDTPIANAWLKSSSTIFGLLGKPIVDHVYFGNGYSIAVRKDNTLLLNQLNEALMKIKADGTYMKIYKKYFE